ncbi:TPA: fimbria/pilus periplasmic chaperone [Escherichia coli]|nr:fimbria/pilus periplasmic chaperone [Escherichia coli]
MGVLIVSTGAIGGERKQSIETSSNEFSLHLGATRVIYNPDSSGESLTVINDHDYPMLVQSEVMSEDQKVRAPFIVTPPLFRLEGGESSRLRIIRTGGSFPEDRETLQWLCVKGIPPKKGDLWAEGNYKNSADNKVSLQVQLSVKSCVKLLLRPSKVNGHPDDVANKLEWVKNGNKLKGTNPTPFYINFSSLKVGGRELTKRHYIPPFSSYEYELTPGENSKIQWQIITDYGGKSKYFESSVKNEIF